MRRAARSKSCRSVLAACLLSGGAVGTCVSCVHYPDPPRLSAAELAARGGPKDSTSYPVPVADLARRAGGLYVMMSFSGGGTRAAALAYGVLRQLEADTLCVDSTRESALDAVDVISSTSGGSFTAAYFAMRGAAGFPEFERSFLRYKGETHLALAWLTPPGLVRLLFAPRWGRSDIAAEMWDRQLFHGATLAAMQHPGAPYVVINATDVATRQVFAFTGEQLETLCIEAKSFPISRAVAASSAVPGSLSPITLRNWAATRDSARCSFAPTWVTNTLHDSSSDPASEPYRLAAALESYRRPDREFVHLVDGGVSDNLGTRALRRLVSDGSLEGSPLSLALRAVGRSRTNIVVVVDARPANDPDVGKSSTAPREMATLVSAADIPFGNFSWDSMVAIREQVAEAAALMDPARRGVSDRCDPPLLNPRVAFCLAEVAFRRDTNVAEREHLEALPTSFQLSDSDVDLLIRVAGRLLHEDIAYKSLLKRYDKSACTMHEAVPVVPHHPAL